MLMHVLTAVEPAVDRIVVVVSPASEEAIARAVAKRSPGTRHRGAEGAARHRRRGEGSAARVPRMPTTSSSSSATRPSSRRRRSAGCAGRSPRAPRLRSPACGRKIPTGYGRLIIEGDQLVAIREERDASEEERRIGFVNGGVMAFAGETCARDPRRHRGQERPERILPDRRRRDRQPARAEGRGAAR